MEIIKPIYLEEDFFSPCQLIEDREEIESAYQDFLTDESKLNYQLPQVIYFPQNLKQLLWALADARKRNFKLTISGGRTGVVGGATCWGTEGLVVLDRWEKKLELDKDNQELVVSPNCQLKEIEEYLSKSVLFYPVDPTEKTATIGGTIATNASGARTYYYGATRRWIKSIKVVLADGGILEIERGQYKSKAGKFVFQFKDGQKELPLCDLKRKVSKAVVGYSLSQEMDLIDLFIGSEGTLGIIVEATLKLIEPFTHNLYLLLFCEKNDLTDLVLSLKQNFPYSIIAMEYMDENSLALLKEEKSFYFIPPSAKSSLYLEIPYQNEEEFLKIEAKLRKILLDFPCYFEKSWAGIFKKDLREMKEFRHALPEKVNLIIGQRKLSSPQLTKISTDMAVPDKNFQEFFHFYLEKMAESGLEYVLFGHIGNSHLHLNILPKNLKEKERAWEYYKLFVEKAISLGGVFSAEHGVGKLKKKFLKKQFSPEEYDCLQRIKSFFDRDNFFNPQNLF